VAVGVLFEALSTANALADAGQVEEAQALAQAITIHFAAMGLWLDGAADEIDAVTRELVSQRDAARAQKNWAEADRLRDELVSRGWVVEDTSAGTSIRLP